MPKHTAFIFVNGEMRDPKQVLAQISPDDFIVAVDGGLAYVLTLGLQPKVLIGDLDSVKEENLNRLDGTSCEIIRFPLEKDETDLELAFTYVLEKGCKQICVAAALGGRLDQTMGNVFMLTHPDLTDCKVRLDDGVEEAFLVGRRSLIFGKAGDTVSLLPLSPKVEGVVTEGLAYPLRSETLWAHLTRGISNQMLGDQAVVSTSEGHLLCLHSRSNLELP